MNGEEIKKTYNDYVGKQKPSEELVQDTLKKMRAELAKMQQEEIVEKEEVRTRGK